MIAIMFLQAVLAFVLVEFSGYGSVWEKIGNFLKFTFVAEVVIAITYFLWTMLP